MRSFARFLFRWQLALLATALPHAYGQDSTRSVDDVQPETERLEALRENPGALLPGIQRQRRQDLANEVLREDSSNALAHLELAEADLATFYIYHNAVSLPGIRFFSRAHGIGDGRTEGESPARSSDIRTRGGIAVSDRFDLNQIEAVGGTILDRSDRGYDALERALPHLEKVYEQAPDNRSVYDHFMRIAAVTGNYEAVLPRIEQMLAHFRDEPEPWLYLGLAQHRLGNEEQADEAFREALDRMTPEERAVYDEVERIRNPRKDSLSVEERESFWRIKDPRYLTNVNERQSEHYARLTYANFMFRSDHIEGDGPGWESDRGAAFVRYGKAPEEKMVFGLVGAAETFAGRRERLNTGGGNNAEEGRMCNRGVNIWDYDDFKLVFCAYGYGPTTWYTLYAPPADLYGMVGMGINPENMDYVTKTRELNREIPERYAYDAPGRVEAPYRLAAFRGEDGMADVYLTYGIPLAGEAGARYRDVPVTVNTGAFVIGEEGLLVERRRTHEGLPGNQVVQFDSLRVWANTEELAVAPGEYEVSFEFETADGSAWTAVRKELSVPDFSGSGLMLSEILLGYTAEPSNQAQPGKVFRDGLLIEAAPWGVYRTTDPILLYFEVYGLGMSGDQTNYQVEAELRPKDDRGFVERIFRDREPGVSNAFPVQADRVDDSQYVILDASGQPPGEYTLTVRIEDRVSGQSVERETELFLE